MSFLIRCIVRIRVREMLQRRPASLPSARARSSPCFVRRLMLARSMAATPAATRATSYPPPATSWASTSISSAFSSNRLGVSRPRRSGGRAITTKPKPR